MLDLCDLVHSLHMERIERRVLADRQVAMAAIAAGAEMELPDLQQAWDFFESALVADPETVDPERDDLLSALGLR